MDIPVDMSVFIEPLKCGGTVREVFKYRTQEEKEKGVPRVRDTDAAGVPLWNVPLAIVTPSESETVPVLVAAATAPAVVNNQLVAVAGLCAPSGKYGGSYWRAAQIVPAQAPAEGGGRRASA